MPGFRHEEVSNDHTNCAFQNDLEVIHLYKSENTLLFAKTATSSRLIDDISVLKTVPGSTQFMMNLCRNFH